MQLIQEKKNPDSSCDEASGDLHDSSPRADLGVDWWSTSFMSLLSLQLRILGITEKGLTFLKIVPHYYIILSISYLSLSNTTDETLEVSHLQCCLIHSPFPVHAQTEANPQHRDYDMAQQDPLWVLYGLPTGSSVSFTLAS